MATDESETRGRVPCGVQGCLFAAVAIFVLLLVGVLIVAFFRFQQPPQGPTAPPPPQLSAISYRLSVPHGPAGAVRAGTDSRRPTADSESDA